MQFQNILIPTDFSGAAEQAAARPHSQRASRPRFSSCMSCPGMAGLARRTGGRRPRSNGYKTSRATPLSWCTLSSWGDPAAEICRVAQERQSDLIAISTHGRTGRELEFIGSVATPWCAERPVRCSFLRAALFGRRRKGETGRRHPGEASVWQAQAGQACREERRHWGSAGMTPWATRRAKTSEQTTEDHGQVKMG